MITEITNEQKRIYKDYQAVIAKQERTIGTPEFDGDIIQCEIHDLVEDFFRLERESTDLGTCDALEILMERSVRTGKNLYKATKTDLVQILEKQVRTWSKKIQFSNKPIYFNAIKTTSKQGQIEIEHYYYIDNHGLVRYIDLLMTNPVRLGDDNQAFKSLERHIDRILNFIGGKNER